MAFVFTQHKITLHDYSRISHNSLE